MLQVDAYAGFNRFYEPNAGADRRGGADAADAGGWLKVLWSWRMMIARKEDMLWSRWGAK
jgi:hypothetical protein